jgi:hypothetical protein
MRCRDWCALCYSNRRGRSNHKGHWGYRRRAPERVVYDMPFMRRVVQVAASAVGAADLLDCEFSKAHPALAEFVSMQAWEDGTRRETGTLFLFVDSGRWKLMLKDRDAKRVAFLTGDTLEELLQTADAGLIDASLDWRDDRPRPQGRGRA